MRTNKTNSNIYKDRTQRSLLMAKKEVSISLDEDIFKKINDTCKNNEFEIKRSVFINSVLKDYFKNKEKNKK